MRTTIAAVSAAAALLLGGAGVATAEVTAAPASHTSTLAADDYGTDNNDNTGLWGLAGLLGLLGLLGLRHRNGHHDNRAGSARSTTLTSTGREAPVSGTPAAGTSTGRTTPATPPSGPGATPPPTV